MTRLGTDVVRHLPTELGMDLGGPMVPVPEQVPGLKAWFDYSTKAQMNADAEAGISSLGVRAGSMGSSATLVQPAAARRPLWLPSVATLNNQPAGRWDGVDDYLEAATPAAWNFLHQGAGASRFWVWRIETAGGNQFQGISAATPSEVGVILQWQTAAGSFSIANGSGTYLNSLALTAPHYAQNVSRWQMWGHGAGVQHARVSCSSLTKADTGSPSAGNSGRTWRVGTQYSGANPYRGPIAHDLYYDHVLTANETTALANYFAAPYGIAV